MTSQPSPKRLRPFVALLLAIAIIPVVVAPSFAQGGVRHVKQITTGKGQRVEKTIPLRRGFAIPGLPELERKYAVYTPSAYDPAEELPLVMVLHGCLEKGGEEGWLPFESIERDTKFDELADSERFIVVYPNHKLEWTSNTCWGWWLDTNVHEGSGEVSVLDGIVAEVTQKYKVDKNRIHIAGISSGGAMIVAALVAYSERFASGSPTAGLPYTETQMNFFLHQYKPVNDIAAAMTAEMGANKTPVPIFIIQSEADTVVNARYAENIRDSWGKAFGVDTQNPISPPESGETKGTAWTHTKYGRGSDGNTVVETLILHRRTDGGLDHGWYGDGEARFAFPNAPDTSKLAWEFFKAHPKNPARAGTPR